MKRRDFIAGLAASPSVAAATGDRAEPQAKDATPAPPKPLTVTLLGTGTPAPSLDRQSSGYLLSVGRDLIVWDRGPGAHQRLIESGHRPIDVTQGAGRIGELKVYGPPPLSRMTEQLFGADGVYGPDIRARVDHRSSLDVYEARGGKLPRTRPAPRVTEIHAGSVTVQRSGVESIETRLR